MNLQAKKLNDTELETISGGEHKVIVTYPYEYVNRNGLTIHNGQTYCIDNNGNYHVTTTYTDQQWEAKEARDAKATSEVLLGSCVGLGTFALLIGGYILVKKYLFD